MHNDFILSILLFIHYVYMYLYVWHHIVISQIEIIKLSDSDSDSDSEIKLIQPFSTHSLTTMTHLPTSNPNKLFIQRSNKVGRSIKRQLVAIFFLPWDRK